MKQVVTRMPDQMAHELRERARIEGRSVNGLVIEALAALLDRPVDARRSWRERHAHLLIDRPTQYRERPRVAAHGDEGALARSLDEDRSGR